MGEPGLSRFSPNLGRVFLFKIHRRHLNAALEVSIRRYRGGHQGWLGAVDGRIFACGFSASGLPVLADPEQAVRRECVKKERLAWTKQRPSQVAARLTTWAAHLGMCTTGLLCRNLNEVIIIQKPYNS